MKTKMYLVVAMLALGVAGRLHAAEITLIAPGGIKSAIEQMIPVFELQTGHKVHATIGPGVVVKSRVAKGEAFDVAVLQPPYPEVLASGHVVAGSERPLADVAVGIAVRTGAPHPDVSTPEAVKAALLAARSIAYPDPERGAAAGVGIEVMLKSLGIAEQLKPKIRLAQGGVGAMAATASGEADIGMTFVSEIISEAGVELAGPLPASMLPPTRLSGLLGAHSSVPAAARELLAYLASPAAAGVYKARGLVPAR